MARRDAVSQSIARATPRRIPSAAIGRRLHGVRRTLLTGSVMLLALGLPMLGDGVYAHPSAEDAWPTTYRRLAALLPTAEPSSWRILSAHIDEADRRRIERDLGRRLDPSERRRDFFLGRDATGRLLGVVTFVGRPEIGVAVDDHGQVIALEIGGPEPVSSRFVAQLIGADRRRLDRMVTTRAPEQRLRTAAHEALVLMAAELGSPGSG
jgi:hypothetical protein